MRLDVQKNNEEYPYVEKLCRNNTELFCRRGGLLIDSDESARGLTFLCAHVGESAGRTTATTAEESGLRNADTRGGRRVRPEERMRRAGNFDGSIPFCIVAQARQKTPGTADAVPGVSGYGE